MIGESFSWKAEAERTANDTQAILDLCRSITRSTEATADQNAAAKALKRSLEVMVKPTPTKLEVARVRYRKLLDLL